MKKIYLAGPDVFEANSIELGKEYVKLCKEYGYEGFYPLDNVINFKQEKEEIAKEIFLKNKELIDKCDILIANLNSFRGYEPDSGTIWECGYGFALGKKVYGYMSSLDSYLNRFEKQDRFLKNNKYLDIENRDIEDFNLPINLMISCSCEKIIKGNLKDVLKYLNKNVIK